MPLPRGLRGLVRLRDHEGDAIICFPHLRAARAERFLSAEDFARLRKRA